MNEEHNLSRYRPFRGSESHHTILYRVRQAQSASVSDVENLVEDYQDVVSEMEEQAIQDTKYFVERADRLEKENKSLETKAEELESSVREAHQEVDQFHQQIAETLYCESELSKFLWAWYALQALDQLIRWVKEEQYLKEYLFNMEQRRVQAALVRAERAAQRKRNRK